MQTFASLASVTLVAFAVMPAARANDLCAIAGTELTCTGDQADGIAVGIGDPTTKLIVEDLNRDIVPASGKGIFFESNGPVEIESNTGVFVIRSVDDGIFAQSLGDAGYSSTSVTHTGDITSSGGRGVFAYSTRHGVSVDVTGKINSSGDGIFAQSGGDIPQASVTVEHDGSITSSSGRGIFAQSARQGVSVTSNGAIMSSGDGVFAESTGDTETSGVTLVRTGDTMSENGRGVYASSARQWASIDNTGNIVSNGDGIFAQSTGNAATSTVTVVQNGNVSSEAGRGIYAYSTNQTVDVESVGNISAYGDAIFAQSTGNASTATVTVAQKGDLQSETGRGIYALSANQAVDVDNEGNIGSFGDGIFAQSSGNAEAAKVNVKQRGNISSETGFGIYANSARQTVTVDMVGNVDALRDGIFARSTGDSEFASVGVTHVGNIMAGGKGIYAESSRQSVTVDMTGDIASNSDGIFAKSTGDAETATAAVIQSGDITAGGYGIYVSSARQAASTFAQGDIESGNDGIFVASTGDAATSYAVVDHTGDINSSTGRGIYAYSARQTVNVTNSGDISSAGEGIFAQSHGDAEGATVTVNQTGDIDAGSTGIYASSPRQAVSVTSTGDIEASNFGVFVQTTGDAIAATATISHTGDVTMQANGIGLYAEASVRAASVTATGDITGGNYGIKTASLSTSSSVTLNGGSVSGAAVAAVSANSITGASVTNRGEVDGGLGLAIEVSGASNLIDNYGKVSGSVIGVGATTAFNNKEGSLLNAGLNISLGDGDLINDGIVGIGQVARTIATTTLDGDFVQSSTGLMRVDVDLDSGASDLLEVLGNADLEGEVAIGIDVFGSSLPRDFTILTASTLGTQDLEIANVVVDGSIDYVGTDVQLTVDALDFAMGGVSGNGNALGDALTSAFESGSSELSSLFSALVDFTDADAYGEAVSQLSPELAAAVTKTSVNTNMQFTNKLMSCKTYTGAGNVNREGECSWVAAEGFSLDYSPSDDNAAFDTKGYMLGTGFQAAVSDVWRAGLGFSYAQSSTEGSYDGITDSNQVAVGAVVKYDAGPLLLAADVTAGYVWSEASRNVDFEGFSDRLSSDSDGSFIGGRLRAAYTHEMGHGYVQPLVDVDLTRYSYGGYSESGGEAAIEVEGGSELVTTVSPSLEIGGDFVGEDGLNYRPYVRAGAILNPDPETSFAASFANAAAGSGSFEITSETDALLGTFAFGFDVITPSNGFGRLVYEGQLGENTESHSLAFKLGASF